MNDAVNEMATLFVYGQLQPGMRFPRQAQLIGPDQVRGRLYDLGDYPAAVDVGQGEHLFRGFLISIPATMFVDLDAFEGVDIGLYRRRKTTTEGDVETWIYEYLRKLPADAVGPITEWPQER